MDAIQEEQGAIIVEAGDEGADTLAQAPDGVLGHESDVCRAELQPADEVERRRDQRSHALFANRAPKRDHLGE